MAASAQAGYGFSDDIEAGLAKIEAAIDEQPDTPAGKILKPDALACVYSGRAVRDLTWGIRDAFEEMAEQMSEMKRASVLRAVEMVPTGGYGLGAEYVAVRESASKAAAGSFVDDLATNAVAKNKRPAAKAATRFATDCSKLEADVAELRLESDSPQPTSIEEISIQAQWEQRARAKPNPAEWLTEKVKAYAATDRVDRFPALLAACDTIILELLDPAREKVRYAATHPGRMYDSQRGAGPATTATQLQALVRHVRSQLEDQWVSFADSLLDKFRPIFVTLVGASPMFLSASERQALYYRGGTGQPPSWTPLAPDAWMKRWLPSSATIGLPGTGAPPGWSRKVAVGSDGVVIRQPAPGSRR
jgi:hypothetical protein